MIQFALGYVCSGFIIFGLYVIKCGGWLFGWLFVVLAFTMGIYSIVREAKL